jgi:chorismate mutase / prephenate dehydratase
MKNFIQGMKVAYLGAKDPKTGCISGGTHSHKAAIETFGGSFETGISYVPCENFSRIFSSLNEGKADFGVVPLINSTSGQVQNVFDLILKQPKTMENLKIIGSMMLHISHDLIGVGSLDDISVVYSKEEAIKQCKKGLFYSAQ